MKYNYGRHLLVCCCGCCHFLSFYFAIIFFSLLLRVLARGWTWITSICSDTNAMTIRKISQNSSVLFCQACQTIEQAYLHCAKQEENDWFLLGLHPKRISPMTLCSVFNMIQQQFLSSSLFLSYFLSLSFLVTSPCCLDHCLLFARAHIKSTAFDTKQ